MPYPFPAFAANLGTVSSRRRVVPTLLVCLTFLGSAGAAVPVAAGRAGGAGLHGSTNGRAAGYLGIEFHDAPPSATAVPAPNVPHGVEVVMVDHDGPAGKAGLRPHDVIVSLNGQMIVSAEALRRMIHDAGSGVQVALSVLRNGRLMTLNAQLATRDEVARAAMAHLAASSAIAPPLSVSPATTELASADDSSTPDPAAPPLGNFPSMPPHSQGFLSSMLHNGSSTGIMVDVMEPQLALYFGAPQGAGLLVQSVDAGSAGALAGLRAGDVLLRADASMLHTQADWTKRVHAAKGRALTLSVLRERHEITLMLQTDYRHHSLLEWPSRF